MYRYVFKVYVRDELHNKTKMTITCGIELKMILLINKHRKTEHHGWFLAGIEVFYRENVIYLHCDMQCSRMHNGAMPSRCLIHSENVFILINKALVL